MIPKVNVNVTATVRVISALKKKPLTDVEQFEHVMKIMEDIPYTPQNIADIAKVEVGDVFEEKFRERLKKVPALKNAIGGIRWVVDVMNVHCEVEV